MLFKILVVICCSHILERKQTKKHRFLEKTQTKNSDLRPTGVRAGGARGAAAPPKFGQLRFFGQEEKIWAKPVFKDVFMFIELF